MDSLVCASLACTGVFYTAPQPLIFPEFSSWGNSIVAATGKTLHQKMATTILNSKQAIQTIYGAF